MRLPSHISPLAWRIILVIGVTIAGYVIAYREIDPRTVEAFALRINPWLAFALLTFLPLLGFPVSVLHIAMGIRFGFAMGLALVGLSILIQLVASFAIVRCWNAPFARWLEPIRQRIPQGAHSSVTLFTLLLPGVPFFVQNYTLPLIGVPLPTLLIWGVPIHFLRSIVTVGIGNQSLHFTREGLAGIAVYAVALLAALGWSYRRMRRQLSSPPPKADGLRQSA